MQTSAEIGKPYDDLTGRSSGFTSGQARMWYTARGNRQHIKSAAPKSCCSANLQRMEREGTQLQFSSDTLNPICFITAAAIMLQEAA
eukprot:s3710_g5.t1